MKAFGSKFWIRLSGARMDPSTEVLNAVTEVNPCTAARASPEWANARKLANTSLMIMPVQQLFEKSVCAGKLT